MTLQPGEQSIIMHILPNISRSKGNRTTKFGQLEAGRLVLDLFLFLKDV